MEPKIKVYGTRICRDTLRAIRFLEERRAPYTWIDVDDDPEALRLIEEVNIGRRTTPTVFFEDGSTLLEPTDEEISRKLG